MEIDHEFFEMEIENLRLSTENFSFFRWKRRRRRYFIDFVRSPVSTENASLISKLSIQFNNY